MCIYKNLSWPSVHLLIMFYIYLCMINIRYSSWQITRSFIRPEFGLLADAESCVCVRACAHVCACMCVCGLQLQTAGLHWVRGDRHRENVNKKIVSSQDSNPLASQSYMWHLTNVTLLVTQDKDRQPLVVSLYKCIYFTCWNNGLWKFDHCTSRTFYFSQYEILKNTDATNFCIKWQMQNSMWHGCELILDTKYTATSGSL